MSDSTEYWKDRGQRAKKSFRVFLKKDIFVSKLLNLRAGTEGFLKSEIKKMKKETSQSTLNILDVACGWGVSFASNEDVKFYGVDIADFPKEIALGNGYVEVKEYGENLTIPYPDDFFDICTIVNLNAHISSSMFQQILSKAQGKIKKGGYLLIVAELNNHGLSHKIMRSLSQANFKRVILGMDHTNYLYEAEFDTFLKQSGIDICEKQTIIGNLVSFIFLVTWATNRSPYNLLKYPSFIADTGLSMIDNLMTIAGLGGDGRRFIVGYKCQFPTDKQI